MKISEIFDLDSGKIGKIYFCSDLHYNHSNVIGFGHRPFDNVVDMNRSIMTTLRDTLKPEDILFTLGDDFWKMKEKDIIYLLDTLPTTNLYKIMGNHDKYGYYWCGGSVGKKYKFVADILDINVKYQEKVYSLVLCHYPIYDFNKMYHGGLHLFGHVHGGLDEEFETNPRLMVDIGYDGELAKGLGSFLISFEDIIEYFNNKTGGVDFDTWGRKNYKSSVEGYEKYDEYEDIKRG